ncbi:MAG: hypothetical protein CMA12_08585 [Euryarchaeota archaeon]|nr:hypothetical protein [Euryarchaeota archaeon]
MNFSHEVFKFDKKVFNFRKLVSDILSLRELEKLHYKFNTDKEIKTIGKDTHSEAHKLFYNKLNIGWPEFDFIYKKFISEFILKKLKKEKILFQRYPNFRVSSPGNLAVSTWHKDSDKNNLHPPGEINFFLPLTECYGNNSLWTESSPGKEDFSSVDLEFGKVFMFDGNNCLHGNRINDTKITRISLDFRLLPLEKYDPNFPHKTRTKNLRFKPGEYYLETKNE